MTATNIPFRLMFSSPAWLPQLDERLRLAQKRWQFCLLEPPFAPGGYTAWVARGSLKDGRRVVLKIGDIEECMHEAEALRIWKDIGSSVHLLGLLPGTLLLEYVEGTNLAISKESTPLLVAMCQELWRPSNYPFPRLSRQVVAWKQTLSQVATGHPLVPYLEELERRPTPESEDRYLLHGDLHREHLFSTARGIVAIDPSPRMGSPAFDVEPLLRAPLDEGDLDLVEQILQAFTDIGLVRAEMLWWALMRGSYYALLSSDDEKRQWIWLRRLEQLLSL